MNTTGLRKTTLRLVAEGLTIFAGVTASLYADDWRDHRNDAQAEIKALQLVEADLSRDSSELTSLATVFNGNARASAWLTERWNSSPDRDSIGRAVQKYVNGAYYRPQDAAFMSLQEGGRLDLIQDDSLRSALIRYYSVSQVELEDIVELHMGEVRGLIDLLGPYFLLFEGARSGSLWPPRDIPARSLSTWRQFTQDGRAYNKIAFVGALAQYGARTTRRNLEEESTLGAAIQRRIEKGP